jgi:hypothetical protein
VAVSETLDVINCIPGFPKQQKIVRVESISLVLVEEFVQSGL